MSISELEQKLKDLSDSFDILMKSHSHLLNAVQVLSDDFYKLCVQLKKNETES
jgi:hypothetical protein